MQRLCLSPKQTLAAAAVLSSGLASACAQGVPASAPLFPNNLVVSRSVYDNSRQRERRRNSCRPIAPPPGGCAAAGATNNGTYPFVFNNVISDASFGITSRIYLDQLTPFGTASSTAIEVPNSLTSGVARTSNQLVTSFSSKSELGLHLSTDGKYLTFMGYVAPVNALDVSNSNTPAVIDPTNPVGQTSYYRAVARIDRLRQVSASPRPTPTAATTAAPPS